VSAHATLPGLYDAEGRPLGGGGLAFTDEQAEAVLRREGPMLLSANAGSGKTAVLAERFVRAVLEDGLAPGELLAITFTEKAAGELRARIRRRFMELGARDAARDMDGAWISTIHGFCARILRAHAVTAGLDPAFVVLDEAIARQARTEAFTVALAQLLAPAIAGGPRVGGAESELELVATWGVDRLHEAIADVHDELRSTGHTVPVLPPVGERPTAGATVGRLRAAWTAVDGERAGWRAGLVSVDAAQVVMDELGRALDRDSVVALIPLLARLKLDKRAKELKSDAVEELRAAAAAVVQAQVDEEAVAVHAQLNRLLGFYASAYADAKRTRSAVDYDDLELLTNDLLAQAPAVSRAYRERFARIMVDEFQDTNPLQLQLLGHLDAGNVFLVGDALQSIYGFRHADVGVFRAQRRRHQELGAAPALATNWRSQPPLLSAVNAAFGHLHEDYVPLVAGRRADAADESPRVQLLLVDDAHDDEHRLPAAARQTLEQGMPPARSVTLLAEARAVAAHVRAVVDAGQCGAGDVAILLRAASDLHVFERALELEGMATLASGGRGYWLRQQVQDLTSYLAALANPVDEPALLAVLASPLVGLSSDALALLAAAGRSRGRGLWAVLTHGIDGVGLAAADRGAVAAFGAWFAAERAQAPLLALDALITRVVARTGYDLHVLGLAGGRRRLANIHKLERLAADFEQGHGRDVRAFIDHVAAEVQAQAREPEAPVELGDLDAVQLMTIHAAKGLEFGVVVVAGLGRQGQNGVGSILVDGDQVGLRLARLHAPNADALDYAALKARAQQAQVQEERRIMHVAFTRAQSHLVISGGVTLGKDLPAERPGGVPLGWVGGCIDPTLVHRLTAAEPELIVDRWVGTERLLVGARLVAVPDVSEPVAGPRSGVPTSDSATTHSTASVVSDVAPRDIGTPSLAGAGAAAAVPSPAPLAEDGGEQLSLAVVAPTAPPAHGGRRGRRGRVKPPAADAAVPGTPPPATVSYSSLEDHAACGYRFYLKRVLGLPDQAPPPEEADISAGAVAGLDPRVRGTIAHALLEADDPSATTADDVREAALDTGVPVTDEDVADLLTLVHAFGQTGLAAQVAASSRVRREEPFAFALDDRDPASPLVNGFIDLVAVLPDGTWLVVDYKTNQVAGADLGAVVEHAYATQRRIYALAALRAGAPAVQVAYVFLQRPGEPVLSVHEATDALTLTAELVAQAAGLLAGRFPVAGRPHRDLCLTCPGRGGMCSWPEEMTLRPVAAPPGAPA
jgi:ATP-dependent helicase/nuclease subunit A